MSYASVIWANLCRNPLRSGLTALCLVVSFMLFGLLQPIKEIFANGPEQSSMARLVVTPKHSTSDLLPAHYADKIAALENIGVVSHMTWFGGTYIDAANFFPQFAVSRAEHLEFFAEIELPTEQRKAFLTTRQGAIVGSDTAIKHGWALGDVIPITPNIWHNPDNTAWEFEVVGIFSSSDPTIIDNTGFYFGFDYFDDYRAFGNGTVGSLLVLGTQPNAVAQTATAIDEQFANSTSETKTMTDREYALNFARQMGDIGLIVNIILGAVIFTTIMLVGNTMAQAARERLDEMAVMKVLGFSGPALVGLTLLEAIALVVSAAAIGLLCAQLVLANLATWAPALGQFGNIKISLGVALQAICIATIIGLIASLPPAIRLARLSIAQALRV